MERAIAETTRRRERQRQYNLEHGIEPRSIVKDVANPLVALADLDYYGPGRRGLRVSEPGPEDDLDPASLHALVSELEKRMRSAAKALEFEEAARLRDRIKDLRRQEIFKV
jgi:excinuclease ABC subunit B